MEGEKGRLGQGDPTSACHTGRKYVEVNIVLLSSAAHRNELPFKLCNYLIPVNLGHFDIKITDFEPKTKGSEIICGKSWGQGMLFP